MPETYISKSIRCSDGVYHGKEPEYKDKVCGHCILTEDLSEEDKKYKFCDYLGIEALIENPNPNDPNRIITLITCTAKFLKSQNLNNQQQDK